MPYATYQQLLNLFGDQRLAAATPLVPASTQEAYWTSKIAATAATIEATFASGGYRVPLDTGTLDEPQKTQVDSMLTDWNVVLAIEAGAPALVAVPKGVDSSADLVRRELQKIIRGTIRFPLTISAKVFGSVYGPDADGRREVAPSLPDTLFHRSRRAW